MHDREDILEIKRLEIIHNKTPQVDNVGQFYEIMDDEGLRERGVDIKVKRESISSAIFYRSYYFSEGILDPSFLKLLVMMTLSSSYLISMTFLFKPMIERGTEEGNKNDTFFSSSWFTGDNWLIITSSLANFL